MATQAWTSQRSGNHNIASDDPASPWHDAGAQTALARYPNSSGGNFDTVTIANGHTVTNPAGSTVRLGDPAAPTTPALRSTSTSGTGIYVNDGTLIVEANVQQGNANWTMSNAFTFSFDHASTALTWLIGDTHTLTSAILFLTGASGARGTVDSLQTAGSFIDSNFLRGGKVQSQYVDFTKIGTSSVASFDFYPSSADTYFWLNCTFTNCGKLQPSVSIAADTTVRVENTVWDSTPGDCLHSTWSSTAKTTGTRTITGNFFDSNIGTAAGGGTWRDTTIEGNVIQRLNVLGSSDSPWASCKNNLIRSTGSSPIPVWDTGVNGWNLLHIHNPAAGLSNIRGLTFPSTRDSAMRYWLIEPGNITSGDGDIIMPPAPGSLRSYTVDHCILAAAAAGTAAGTRAGLFLSLLGSATVAIADISHNTFVVSANTGESGGVAYGETYQGYPGIIGTFVNNLVISTNGQGYGLIRRITNLVADGFAAANAHHNGMSGVDAGNVGVPGYSDTSTTTTQSLRCVGTLPTSGTFRLNVKRWDGTASADTVDILYNASGSTIDTAIEAALTTAGETGFTVTATNGTTLFSSGSILNFTVTKGGVGLPYGYLTIAANGLNTGTPIATSPMFSTTAGLGASDKSDDPQIGATRTIGGWAVARGYSVAGDYATQVTDAYTALKTDTAARVADLITYWRDAWIPTNGSYRNSAADGGTMGALEGQFPAAATGRPLTPGARMSR